MTSMLSPAQSLPRDAERATLVGRLWLPDVGPVLVAVHDGDLHDLSRARRPPSSQLLEVDDPVGAVREALRDERTAHRRARRRRSPTATRPRRDTQQPWLLAPCDLQAVKASGVTFVASLLERVIEEQARGDASKAEAIRAAHRRRARRQPRRTSCRARRRRRKVKEVLIAQGAWSQYLEVGIGPDAEIFTKAPVLSAVGTGADVGIHSGSVWNNPEPEVVLAVNSRGQTLGAALGNDVNLRDFEGRSALLLGKAKDNNASCAIGPFIRLFDAHFGIDDVRRITVALRVIGPEGFTLDGSSSLVEDQPRSARPGVAGHRPAPRLPGRLDAVPGHDVRADPGPARARARASRTWWATG